MALTLSKWKTFFRILLLVSSAVYVDQLVAWGQTGHRVTGEIAQRLLSPDAQKAIEILLPNESLAEASTYADEMRSHPSTFWKKTASPWHYVTVPENKVYAEVIAPSEGDAVTALNKFTEDLKSSTSSTEEKQLALRFIIHIIGDLHQPLHAGNGTDRGGNDLTVIFFREFSNLHRVWDSDLIDKKQLSYTEWSNWLFRKISADDIAAWASTDPKTWIGESVAIRDKIYPKDPKNVSWDYQYQSMPYIKQRLSMGGVRIALYLNKLFDQSD